MFEYKSEIVSLKQEQEKKIKIVLTANQVLDTTKLDELINAQAADGWDLVTHSISTDGNMVADIMAVVTFRRPK